MRLTGLHQRLLADVLAVGAAYPLVLTGGYAVQAHGLVDRLSQDLDVATENHRWRRLPRRCASGWKSGAGGYEQEETDPLDADTGEECEVDILKETFWRPAVNTEHGPVLAIEDVVGTKVRALADRGLARDLIDIHAAADRWTQLDLEELGRRHARGEFDLADLQLRLAGADWIDDSEFAAYGLNEVDTAELRAWAQTWADDIAQRLHQQEPFEES